MDLLDRISSISIGSSDVQPSESPYLHVLFIGTSQSRQHDKSESFEQIKILSQDLKLLDKLVFSGLADIHDRHRGMKEITYVSLLLNYFRRIWRQLLTQGLIFFKYIERSLEEDFKVVVGIRFYFLINISFGKLAATLPGANHGEFTERSLLDYKVYYPDKNLYLEKVPVIMEIAVLPQNLFK
ncbi:uncharacterized mitochondrial protein-like protein, partial [Tanacetum coccineum]